MKELRSIVISDSTGETGEQIAKSILVHFPNLEKEFDKLSHIDSEEKINEIFEKLDKEDKNTFIISSLVDEKLTELIKEKCEERGYISHDLLNEPIKKIEECTGEKGLRVPGLIRELDSDYFSKIEAIEFAVKYDDGRDTRGFYDADIVLIGVSRTSKTPLSILLAYKNIKVANLPLVPEIPVPDELFDIDPRKIIGLTINPDNLNEIRKDRLEVLGLGLSTYAEEDRIREEIEYANELFDELGCKVINVSEQTIEQTASEIIRYKKSLK